jgi:hypothetical protein
MPGMPSGSESRACLASRSASDTTPITLRFSSMTGNALTRYWRSRAAISLKEASRRTATTSLVITSLTSATVALILVIPFPFAVPQRLRTTLSAPVSAARLKTS